MLKSHFHGLLSRLSLSLVLAAALLSARAQAVAPDEARAAANAFLSAQGIETARSQHTIDHGGATLLYIFDAAEGYVVVSGDRQLPPVLAFIDHTAYDAATIAPPARMWLDFYAAQVEAARTVASPTPHPTWQRIAYRQPMRNNDALKPLIQSHWNQDEPYNYYCPQDFAGPGSRCVTGCVATALSQIIYYFRFPDSGVGTYSYTHETYGTLSADYENAHYDYAAMCDEPTTVNLAISRLMADCGIGMDMDYGPDGSGVHNHSAGRVLREHFKYMPTARSIFRDSTTLDWDSLLLAHLNRHIPIYYAGWSVPDIDGHGFVCDGYRTIDSTRYYHFNFGWGGNSDGYFYTTSMNVGNTHFNLLQEIVIDGYPDTANYEYPVSQPLTGNTILTAAAGSFTDGSLPHLACADGMDYTWTIRPDAPHLGTIKLNLDHDLAVGDTLTVTAGSTTYTFAADTAAHSEQWTWSDDEVILHLRTATGEHGTGFRASYQTTVPAFCENYTYSNASSGHIEDGSGSEDYNALTYCQFKIKATGFPSAILHFTEFDLEEGHDFLHVFHKTPSAENWLVSFSGTMPDTSIFFTQRDLYFIFETDEANNAGGFAFDYEGTLGVGESESHGIDIYPNPATTLLHLESETPLTHVEVCNIAGQRMIAVDHTGNELKINLQELPAGIYILRLTTDSGMVTKKFVKR